ncbi:MAG: NifU family protein [Armatimonadetes bacterium]|nr:NifU family protein [Armatimonadota bacterium]
MFFKRKRNPTDEILASPLELRVADALIEVQAYAKSHGGGITLLEVTEHGEVIIRLKGTCSFCPISKITIQKGVVEVLKEIVPEITKITVK